ncbi:MAG: hypothetical protein M0Z95_06035 [Actinomycetota bacterium]|nr:hypothetical protein [Actinomycetota bacterium]
MPVATLVSYRLGGSDGVSVESAKWARALRSLGYEVRTLAGAGSADRLVPELTIDARSSPDRRELETALAGTDVVVAENICSLPLNPAAGQMVAECLRGRPAILHHHDLPWQRAHLSHHPPPPDDPAWRHVTINRLSRQELAERGIESEVVYNTFDIDTPQGRREDMREAMEVSPEDVLVLQPTRALPRKNVPGAVALAEALGATYWLLGPAEDGYGPELERLLRGARCPVRRGMPDGYTADPGIPKDGAGGTEPWTVSDAYAAADVVALPSTWEGFGNPALESVVHRRLLAIGPYPVGKELAQLGFEWFDATDPGALAAWLARPDPGLFERNLVIARRFFSISDLPARLAPLLESLHLPVLLGTSAASTGPPPGEDAHDALTSTDK